MTVQQMIAQLQRFPSDMEVVGVEPSAELEVSEFSIDGSLTAPVVLIGQV